jgi:glucose-6-phosphate isomerase
MKLIINEKTKIQYIEKLTSYISHCRKVVEKKDYSALEASLCLPTDEAMVNEVKKMINKKKTANLKYVVVVGIGGSNLGTKAIYDALFGTVDTFHPERYPKMIFLDTTDPEYMDAFQYFIKKNITSPEELAIVIISKSGGTTETAVNAEIVIESLKKKFSSWKDRCVVITDKDSLLWKSSEEKGIDRLEIPNRVGGRYSVFSPVGLFPLALCGINIDALLHGASSMRKEGLSTGSSNSAVISASFLFEQMEKGMSIHDSFYFHSELESLGKWYRQLMGESIGKEGKGLTPTVSIGSVDLHSVAQLYLGGPKNKVTSFVYTNIFNDLPLPSVNILSHIKSIEGKKMGDIMRAIQQGTIAAYTNSNLPHMLLELDGITLREIGAYMQMKMMEIMYLAHLMRVNAFDQPQVELYKIETKKILDAK